MDIAGGDMGLETEDKSGEAGADDSDDAEQWRRTGLRIFFRGRSNAAAGRSSKTGASCGRRCFSAEELALTPFPFHLRPQPPPTLSTASIPTNTLHPAGQLAQLLIHR